MSVLCCTVAGMVTPKGSMSTEGETDTPSFCPTLQVLDMSLLLCLSWAAEFGSSGEAYELPCIMLNSERNILQHARVLRSPKFFPQKKLGIIDTDFIPSTPELNPSAQRCLTRILLEFCFLNLHFVNIRVKNQQIHQLFIQFTNYVW
jgi:hypothetical protein